jgi:GMP synthase (glutamine-hydrolysing)
MRALAIVHQRDAGPGVFEEIMRERVAELDIWLRAEEQLPPRDPLEYDAVLTFGGAMHVDHEERHPWLRDEKELLRHLLRRKVPLLGVCLGAQLVAEAAGAPARRAEQPEIGWFGVELTAEGLDDPVLGPLAPGFEAFQWHSYEFPLPPGATPLARSAVCLQAFRWGDAAWGIQFHAEATLDIAEGWIDDYRSDEDAVRIELDAEALRERTRLAIGSWNELGRGLCERFLGVAAQAHSGVT